MILICSRLQITRAAFDNVIAFFQVSSEESVFEAMISWVRHSPTIRESFLPQLLNFVRLPLLSARYITDVIDEEVRNN